MRATCFPLSLPLLVPGVVRADHQHPAPAPDDLAPIAHLLDRRPDLHSSSPTGTGRRSAPAAGRRATAPPAPDPPGGSGCSASASSPRYVPTPCVRCRALPGTSRWAAVRPPCPLPLSHPSSAYRPSSPTSEHPPHPLLQVGDETN